MLGPHMLTKHFKVGEFRCHCCGEIKNYLMVAEMLERLREAIKMPITVNSGYRCYARNAIIGGEIDSLHLIGKAADITCDNLDALKAAALQEPMCRGVGLYSTHVHVDMRVGNGLVWADGLYMARRV